MQNKNNIKNWKIEITNEGAKLFITEGAVMARDVLNLAREQAIKYNLSNLKIYTVYMRDGYYYDYTFEDDMLYFIHMTEKIENEDISYLMKRAAEKLSTLKLDDRIWSVNFLLIIFQERKMEIYMLPVLWSFIFMIEMMIMKLIHNGFILIYRQDNGNLLKM